MNVTNLSKTHTGISAEFFAAAELTRRNFNVTVTFGNTKSIDLLAEKYGKLFSIQVKGIQRRKSICWNLSRDKIQSGFYYIFVNLNADSLESPEFFILSDEDALRYVKPTRSGRDYLDYNFLKRETDTQDNWGKFTG